MKAHIGFPDPAKIAESREKKCKGCIFERRKARHYLDELIDHVSED